MLSIHFDVDQDANRIIKKINTTRLSNNVPKVYLETMKKADV